MNDRFLYRAKRKDNGEWIEGNLVWSDDTDDDYKAIIIPTTGSDMFTRGGASGDLGFEKWYRVDPSTLCQCIGIKDKNGKLIWENDVVTAWSQGANARGKVKKRIDGLYIIYPAYQKQEFWGLYPDESGRTTVEVIGNIFDNLELLEAK